VAEIDVMHFHWDLFEDIIQVDYDEPIAWCQKGHQAFDL
jgi:hypothetical protein